MHVLVSGAMLLPILRSGVGPGSSAEGVPTFADPEFPGVLDDVLTIGEIVAKVEARGEIPPKMILINSTVDYLTIRASLGRTGATGTTDLPMPANVRMYDVAGAAHVNVAKIDGCNLAPGRLDWAPVVRATLATPGPVGGHERGTACLEPDAAAIRQRRPHSASGAEKPARRDHSGAAA